MSSVKRENSGCYFTKALNAKCNVTQYILDLDYIQLIIIHVKKVTTAIIATRKSNWKIKSYWIKWGDLAYTCI